MVCSNCSVNICDFVLGSKSAFITVQFVFLRNDLKSFFFCQDMEQSAWEAMFENPPSQLTQVSYSLHRKEALVEKEITTGLGRDEKKTQTH